MNLKTILATKNNCYKAGKKHTPKGFMLHSTGDNNPELRRYVAPDDGTIGKNQYDNDFNRPTPGGREICPHGWIGKLKDGSIATVQTLPWDMIGWHSGGASKGNANFMGYIGVEICEDGLTDSTYFNKVYKEAVELVAYLFKKYSLPVNSTTLICHSEGHKLGIASNHGDVMHWFPKHGKSMDTFRADVKKLMEGTTNMKEAQYSIVATRNGVPESKLNDLTTSLKNQGFTVASRKTAEAVYESVSKTIQEGDKVAYNGVLYASSYGDLPGSRVNGTYTVTRLIKDRSHGALLNNGLGWVKPSDLKKV